MWLSNKELSEREQRAYDTGLAVGYGLGYHAGQVESFPQKSLIEKQIENILKENDERN